MGGYSEDYVLVGKHISLRAYWGSNSLTARDPYDVWWKWNIYGGLELRNCRILHGHRRIAEGT